MLLQVTEFGAMVRDSGLMSMGEAKKVFILVQQSEAGDQAADEVCVGMGVVRTRPETPL